MDGGMFLALSAEGVEFADLGAWVTVVDLPREGSAETIIPNSPVCLNSFSRIRLLAEWRSLLKTGVRTMPPDMDCRPAS